VQDWLTGNCWLLGSAGQNWMLVAGGGLVAYVAALAYARRPHKRPRPAPPEKQLPRKHA
jgi:hypothetical protein